MERSINPETVDDVYNWIYGLMQGLKRYTTADELEQAIALRRYADELEATCQNRISPNSLFSE